MIRKLNSPKTLLLMGFELLINKINSCKLLKGSFRDFVVTCCLDALRKSLIACQSSCLFWSLFIYLGVVFLWVRPNLMYCIWTVNVLAPFVMTWLTCVLALILLYSTEYLCGSPNNYLVLFLLPHIAFEVVPARLLSCLSSNKWNPSSRYE